MDSKFTGICIVIAAVVLAAAILWNGQVGRYQSVGGAVKIDTVTGAIFN